ncbi:MAG: HlyD family efflux transporter periplasmic adaptor subunit [Bacteroidales bacterium]
MKNPIIILLPLLCILSTSCREKDTGADAWGNFEATETMVSSESGGRIIFLNAPEGSVIEKGAIVAIIDTTMLSLQKDELKAGIGTVAAKVNALMSQNSVIRQQIANLDINIERTRSMMDDQAATQKQLDDLTGQKSVLEKQAQATDSQAAATETEKRVMEARLTLLAEQISRCSVRSPVTGTILTRYIEEGEITAPGKPLAKIADLTIIQLKAWVSGSQLGLAQPGAACTVRIDEGDKGFRYYEGTIVTVSSRAEFTPKVIQTKEERVNLVYAVTIEVKNDGYIRTGMPGEVIFSK